MTTIDASSAAPSAIVDAAVITSAAPEINWVFVPGRDRLSQPCIANSALTQ